MAVQGKGKEPRISGLESQAESAGTDLHPQTGHLLPRTNGSQMLNTKEPLGEGDHNAVGGMEAFQHRVTSSLRSESQGEKNRCLHSWARECGQLGVGAAVEGSQATILLIVPSGPITERRRLAEWHPQEKCRCLTGWEVGARGKKGDAPM